MRAKILHSLSFLVALATLSWFAATAPSSAAQAELRTPDLAGSHLHKVASPNVGVGANKLVAVSALSATDAWAVGGYSTNHAAIPGGIPYAVGMRTLAAHWDGRSWQVVPTPNVGTVGSILLGVVAIAKGDAWAVGAHDVNSGPVGPKEEPLTEHWDGHHWTVVESTHYTHLYSGLRAVTFASPNDVYAVGYSLRDVGSCCLVGSSALIHWNGRSWNRVGVPDLICCGGQEYASIAVTQQGQLLLAGQSEGDDQGQWFGIVARHDASGWHVDLKAEFDQFKAVTLVGARAWAIGQSNDIQYRRAGVWRQLPMPSGLRRNAYTTGIAGQLGDSVYVSGSDSHDAFLARWNGRKWTLPLAPTTTAALDGSRLSAVAVAPSGAVFAVGQQRTSRIAQTLIYQDR